MSFAVGINILLCFVFIGFVGLLLIGAWQVLDAIIFVASGDKRRRPYLLVVVAYFIIFAVFPKGGDMLFIWYVGVLANIIALWYCYIVETHAGEVSATAQDPKETYPDILDADV